LNVNSRSCHSFSEKRDFDSRIFQALICLEGITQPKERKFHGLTLDELTDRNIWSAYNSRYMKNLRIPEASREIWERP
jgi:hypothetical protein